MIKHVAVNDRGSPIGECHHKAELSNHEVDMLLEFREEGWSYKQLADKFEIKKSTVRNICKGICRCQSPHRFKLVEVK